jgi:hypothetical protein
LADLGPPNPVRDEITELDWGDGRRDKRPPASSDGKMLDAARARGSEPSRDEASRTLDLEAIGSPAGDGIDDASTFDTAIGPPVGPANGTTTARHAPAFVPAPSGVQPPAPSPPGASPAPLRPGPTQHLHPDDEDGPTMVAFPPSLPDQEATHLHNSFGPRSPGELSRPPATAPPHGALGGPRPELPASERTVNLPNPLLGVAPPPPPPPAPVQAVVGPAAAPPPVAPPPVATPMLGVQAALREAAVQAALAAATASEDSPEAVALRAERLDTVVTVLLGVGLVAGALGSHLSASALRDGEAARGAAYAATSLVASFALFGSGLAALQKRSAVKISLVLVSAALLVFALARVVVIAAG